MIQKYIMELIDVKISRRPKLIRGVKIKEGNQWVLVNHNLVDYVLDGYSFINKKYIKKVVEVSKEVIDYKIIKMRYDEKISDSFSDLLLESYQSLLSSFLNTSKLVAFEFESSEYCIIGVITKINEKSFRINKLSTKGIFLGEENFEFNSIRIIDIETDYLNALEGFLNESKNEK